MKPDELQEMQDYWEKKYPNVFISLNMTIEGDKYIGKMISYNENINLLADTFGELINKGEEFLRRIS